MFPKLVRQLIHFDLLRVQENTKVTVEVPVIFLNQEICPGLKQGGVLNLVRRFVELYCSANSIPEKLEFDLIDCEIGDSIKINSIKLPDDVKLTITDRDFVIATLSPPTVEVEEEKPEEEGLEGEGAEGAEGAESAEGAEGAEGEVKDEKSQDKDKKEEQAEKKSK